MATLTQPFEVRVGTWNIREGRAADGGALPPAFATQAVKLVNEESIDVLALQEVDFDATGRSTVIEALRSDTDLRYVRQLQLSPSSFEAGHDTGLAIASRFELIASQHSSLPNPMLTLNTDSGVMHSFDKGTLECVVRVADRRFSIICVHLFPFERFRRKASEIAFQGVWAALGEQLSDSASGPLIVAGDFNTSDRGLVLDHTDVQLSAALGGEPTHGSLAVDEVFYSEGLVAKSTHVVQNMSDHALCVVELELI